MIPVNNFHIKNEIPSSIYEESLKQKFYISEEYAKEHPEESSKLLLLEKCLEYIDQSNDRIDQNLEEIFDIAQDLKEDSKIFRVQTREMIELEKKSRQTLEKISKSSSDIKEMTQCIANVVKRFFLPVKNGFQNGLYFLTGHRAAVLPGENQLAIEYNLKGTTSTIDPTNQLAVNEKKACKFIQIFYGCRWIISLAFRGVTNFLIFTYKFTMQLISIINSWIYHK